MKKGDFIWGTLLAAIIAFLTIPATNGLFMAATQASPYLMGFVKFAVLATMGEFLAIRITSGTWRAPCCAVFRAIIWGVVGMLIVLMFQIFPAGVAAAADQGYLWVGNGRLAVPIRAFLTSFIMNFTFGPVFMALHRITDTVIDRRCQGEKTGITGAVGQIDWADFIRFVVGKTIPFFWIPMHTISFLLPSGYRVLFAGFLSIALGAILAYAKRRVRKKAAA